MAADDDEEDFAVETFADDEPPALDPGCELDLDLDLDLDPDAQPRVTRAASPERKLHVGAFATVAGICVIAVVFAWLTEVSLQLSVLELELLTATGGLTQVFGIVLAFAAAGLTAALVFAGRYLGEVVLGAAAGVAVQLGLWVYMARAAGATLRGDLRVSGGGFEVVGPAPILISQLLLLMLVGAILFAFAGWVAREQITRHATCISCDSAYSLRPTPPVRCPHCDAEQDRDGVQWPQVVLAGLVTAIVFAVIVALLREPLGFAFECHVGRLSPACKVARAEDYEIFVTSTRAGGRSYWAIDQWRYLGLTSIVMLLAPLVLSWVVKRGSRASALALVPVNWLVGTLVIMVAFADLSGSESGLMFLLRLQVLALISWGVLGVVGAALGVKLQFRRGSAYLDELDESKPAA